MRCTSLRLAWTMLRRPWMEAEGSATGAGGIGAASPAAGAGAASSPLAPQLSQPPLPQQLLQHDLHLWHLNRLAKKPQRFRLQQLLQADSQHEGSQAGSQQAGSQASCSQQAGSQASSQQLDLQHLLQSNRPFSRPNRCSLGRQHELQHDCSQQAGSQQAGSQQAGSQQAGSQQLLLPHDLRHPKSRDKSPQRFLQQELQPLLHESQQAGSQQAGSQQAGAPQAPASQQVGSQHEVSQQLVSQQPHPRFNIRLRRSNPKLWLQRPML
ncbi:MAG TPA: hypothetical protein VMV10_32000, partial [Pirellulales bacterium]|nr:hypothetical protein [Pirellulales bacterium]